MGRDYRQEYLDFQSSRSSKKKRAELNRINHTNGTYGNNDNEDVSHQSDGSTTSEDSSTNKGRNEKSRKKGSDRKPFRFWNRKKAEQGILLSPEYTKKKNSRIRAQNGLDKYGSPISQNLVTGTTTRSDNTKMVIPSISSLIRTDDDKIDLVALKEAAARAEAKKVAEAAAAEQRRLDQIHDQGELSQAPEEGYSKEDNSVSLLEMVANPMKTLKFYKKNPQMTGNWGSWKNGYNSPFRKPSAAEWDTVIGGGKDAHDIAMDVVNPFAWANYASKITGNLQEGEYLDAGFNTLGAIPGVVIPGQALAKETIRGGLRSASAPAKSFLGKMNSAGIKSKQILESPFKKEFNSALREADEFSQGFYKDPKIRKHFEELYPAGKVMNKKQTAIMNDPLWDISMDPMDMPIEKLITKYGDDAVRDAFAAEKAIAEGNGIGNVFDKGAKSTLEKGHNAHKSSYIAESGGVYLPWSDKAFVNELAYPLSKGKTKTFVQNLWGKNKEGKAHWLETYNKDGIISTGIHELNHKNTLDFLKSDAGKAVKDELSLFIDDAYSSVTKGNRYYQPDENLMKYYATAEEVTARTQEVRKFLSTEINGYKQFSGMSHLDESKIVLGDFSELSEAGGDGIELLKEAMKAKGGQDLAKILKGGSQTEKATSLMNLLKYSPILTGVAAGTAITVLGEENNDPTSGGPEFKLGGKKNSSKYNLRRGGVRRKAQKGVKKFPYGRPAVRKLRSSLGLKGMTKKQRERYNDNRNSIIAHNKKLSEEEALEEEKNRIPEGQVIMSIKPS